MINSMFQKPKIMVIPGGYMAPAKVHLKKKWMSENYHYRIQKKWTKRFGMKFIETVVRGTYMFDSKRNVMMCRAEDVEPLLRETYG